MKDKNPLISIIVPIYNGEKYLEYCINSIINQTYKNIEIILIDDGSKDNSGKICDTYKLEDDRIVVVHQKNYGVSNARNNGLKIANGEWISFVDCDDWIEKDFIEVLFKNAISYKSDVVLSGYSKVYKNNVVNINSSGKIDEYSQKDFLIKVLNVQTSFGFVHMKLMKRELLQNLFFDENLKVSEDALFCLKLCKNILSNVLIVQKPLYNYRVNTDSVVRRYDENYCQKYLNSMIKIKQFINEEYSDDDYIYQNFYNFVVYHIMLILVNYCFNPDNNTNKLKLLKEICNIELFREAIEKSNYNELSFTRKISLFTIKHKLYYITSIICKIRQLQIR